MPQETTPSRTLVKCSQCGAQRELGQLMPGARIKCGQCGTLYEVPEDPMVGRTIGGYRILQRIGQGGMGAVYLAEQVRLRRKVAFKALKGGRSQDKDALASFHREAISAAQLSHANVVQVYDIAMADGVPFISMEYVDGKTLQDLLDERKKLAPAEVAAIAAQVLEALGRAHKAGIVHRDVKPGNIMIDADGHVKVTDFGLARMMEAPGSGPEKRLGTVLYIPPEQIRSGETDHRADLYSLGATMFRALTGRAPFRGGSAKESLRLTVAAPVPDPCAMDPSIPRPLADLVVRMLAKSPDRRPQDAWEALDALRATGLLRSDGAGWLGKRRRKVAILAGGGLVAAAALALAVGLWLGVGPFAYRDRGTANGPDAPAQGDSAEEARLAQLREMLQFAREYEEENPDSYSQILDAYAAVAELGEGTRFGLEAKTRIASVEERRREAAAERFGRMRDEAMEHARSLRYEEAVETLAHWPNAFANLGYERRLADLRQEAGAAFKEEIERLVAEAAKALDEDELDRAQELVERLAGVDLSEVREATTQLEEELKARRQAIEEEWAAQARRRRGELLREVFGFTSKRQYSAAQALLEESLADERLQTIHGMLEREAAHLATARSVLHAAVEALDSGKADGLRIRGILHRFISIEDGDLVLELFAGGPEERVDIKQVPAREIVRLARIGLEPLDGEKQFRIGVFCLYDGAFEKARNAFEEAAKAGHEVPRYLRERAETENFAPDRRQQRWW